MTVIACPTGGSFIRGKDSRTDADVDSSTKALLVKEVTGAVETTKIQANDGAGNYDEIYRTNNALDVNLKSSNIDAATETTLKSIDTKITKCDTDNTTVSKRVSSSFTTGQTLVGTSRVQLTTSSTPSKFRVIIKADDENLRDVYIGGSGVNTQKGYVLKPGQEVSLEIDDASKVYAISTDTGQKLYWIAV